MTTMSDEKWQPLNYFAVLGAGGSPMEPDPENMVCAQDNRRPGRPVSCGLQVCGEPGHYRARTGHLLNFPRRFSFKMSFSCIGRDE
jgi:hypothetical protein